MAGLTGTQIKNTYGDVLQVGNSGSGITSSLRTVNDGLGTATAFQISTVSGAICGTTFLTTPSGGSGVSNFLNLTGTQPTTLTAAFVGINFQVTSAGSSSFTTAGMTVSLQAGYTGSSSTIGLTANNSAAGTANATLNVGNFGAQCLTNPTTTGNNFGFFGNAVNGNLNVGCLGRSLSAKDNATNIGVIGHATNTGASGVLIGGYFALHGTTTPTFTSAALMCDNAALTSDIFVARDNGVNCFVIADGGLVSKYNSITTAGLGLPAIYGSGRSTAQTAAVATVATYTVGATDGAFLISANVNVTTSTTHTIAVQVDYTDETNTARTLTLAFVQLGGTIIASITNVTGAGPYEGIPVHIRCKAATAITIKTTGTFTTVTYNVEGSITQIA